MLCLHSCTVPALFSRDRVFFHFCFYNSCQVFTTKAFLPHRAEQILLQFCRWVPSLKKLFHLLQTSKKHSLCIHFMTCDLRKLQAIVCIVKTVKVLRQWFVQIQDFSTSVIAANHRELLAVMRARSLRFVPSCWHCKAFSTHCTNSILNRTD